MLNWMSFYLDLVNLLFRVIDLFQCRCGLEELLSSAHPAQVQGPGQSPLPAQARDAGLEEASLLDTFDPSTSTVPLNIVPPAAPLSSSGDEYLHAVPAPGVHGAVGDLGLAGLRYCVPPPPLGCVPVINPPSIGYLRLGPGYSKLRGDIVL